MKAKSHNYNNFVVIDFETGDLTPLSGAATELGCCIIDGNTLEVSNPYSSLILPYSDALIYDPKALAYSNITMDEILKNGQPIAKVFEDFLNIVKQATKSKHPKYLPILVGHNAPFDIDFLVTNAEIAGIDLSKLIQGREILGIFIPNYVDTMTLTRMQFNSDPTMTTFKLSNVLERCGIEITDAHRALNDVLPTAELFIQWTKKLRNDNQQVSSSHITSMRATFQF